MTSLGPLPPLLHTPHPYSPAHYPTGTLVLPRPVSGACPLAAISIGHDLVLRLIPALEDDVATVSSSWLKG